MKKIKEISEFAKMFRLNVPVEEQFEYYIQTLSNSFEYKDVAELVNSYSEFEDWLKENGYNNVGHYKMNYAYNLLINTLESSEAYERCLQFDYSDIKLETKDHLKMYEGNYLFSLDFSSANFQSVKVFDNENKLKSNWEEFCSYLGIHPMLSKSKSYRQLIFGNINPKRFQKFSHYHILKLVNDLQKFFPSEDIVSISHDEIVINLGVDKKVASERVEQIIEVVKYIKENRISNGEIWMETHSNIFKMKKISKGVYVKTIYYLVPGTIISAYKTLFGCPGNVYYINFKKHIIKEEVLEKDCLFVLDNKIAKWVL